MSSDAILDGHFQALYAELHAIARKALSHERAGHTLCTTDLLHEAFARLRQSKPAQVQNETHFKRLAAKAMRQVLLDYAKSRNAQKRSGAGVAVFHSDMAQVAYHDPALLLDLESAMQELTLVDEKASFIAESRLFGDSSEEEIGLQLGISTRYVRAKWALARAYLQHRLAS